MQTFVFLRIIVLMAAAFYKWLILPFFTFPVLTQTGTDWKNNAVHPFFVAVTEVNHNSTDKTLEISCKLFIDDFEKVLTQKYKSIVSIMAPKDKAALDKQISQYLMERLSLKADGKSTSYRYLGFEKEEDAVYCFMEVVNIAELKKLDVTNSILHDLNTNQINIMHITVGGNRKSHKLDYPKSEVSFSF